MGRKEELLAMLTPHGVTADKVYGGTPSLTAQDVAAMMAKCSDCESALLRAKYCGESESKAWAYWFQHLMKQGWHDEPPGITEKIATMTLDEFVNPNKCTKCKGTESATINQKIVVCPHCGGSGFEPYSERKAARRLGLGNKVSSPWAERVGWCLKELRRVEYRALQKIGQNI